MDATNFTTLQEISTITSNAGTYELMSIDFSSYPALNDESTIYIKCTFDGATSSNGSYRIDNVQFNFVPVGPDTYSPKVVRLEVENDTTLAVTFNELLDETSAQTATNYLLDNVAALQAVLASTVVTVTVPPMIEGSEHTFMVKNVADTAGNIMPDTTITFTYGIEVQYHVPNIAELRSKWTTPLNPDSVHFGNQIYKLTGHAIVTAMNKSYRNQIFIQDSTAAIVIDDVDGHITRILEQGDEITNIYGKLTDYYGQLQFAVTENCSDVLSPFNDVTPLTVTLSQLEDNDFMNAHQSELIRMDNVQFVETGTFDNGLKYHVTQSGTTDEAVWIHIYNVPTLTGTPIPTFPTNITGVNKINHGKYYLIPRSGQDLGTGICRYLSADDITIFPNPVKNTLYVVLNNYQYQVNILQIFDLNGKLLRTVNAPNPSMNISVNTLSSGTYFLRLSDGKASYTTKFIKK